MFQKNSTQLSQDGSLDPEEESFLGNVEVNRSRTLSRNSRRHIQTLYTTNFILLAAVLALLFTVREKSLRDPSLGIYSPANEAVEYIEEQWFRAALFNNTPYMGYPDDEKDKLWEDLYNFGTSTISEKEAKKLPHPTLPIPGTKRYLVQLDVWHQLHCLNDLRKLLYPDRFPGLEELKDENGVVDMTDSVFRHWAHGVFPRLSTSHTCRNFGKIQEWAKENAAGVWDPIITPQQAAEIIQDADFDQSPFEDIEFLYDQFPGNPWFRYWREHPQEAEVARKKFGGLEMS
ncbi:hypothetical protein PVAG01_05847 [Phlyctema vagabunda]|uniref:Uncharacterized protein n=1 Tax=Phlyctema vagabunda TaxID=108571 RepID=A0ABR4PEE0_9HELO